MSGECQVNVKSQSELDIGGRETCLDKFLETEPKSEGPPLPYGKFHNLFF